LKKSAAALVFLASFQAALAQFPPQIKNVVILFQENRTPDNLFHFLTPACPIPAKATGLSACTPELSTSCYDIAPCGLSNQTGKVVPYTLQPVSMVLGIDPLHTHAAYIQMCDPEPNTFACRNDGAWQISTPLNASYTYVENPAVTNSDGSKGYFLDPYLTLAKDYGWANRMFQTNQGPSFPAHQYIFAGTSAVTAEDDANSLFIAENFGASGPGENDGCLAQKSAINRTVAPAISTPPAACVLSTDNSVQECRVYNDALVYPTSPQGSFCATHESMGDLLSAHNISWKYYAPAPDSIWTAPDAIASICQPGFSRPSGQPDSALECTGPLWNQHVDTQNLGTDILRDISKCDMANVSWVMPNGTWSDHPAYGFGAYYGPSWIASVVNAIGNNPTCPAGTADAGQNYWQNTAIIITWDDWGGFSDHVPSPNKYKLPCKSLNCTGDYEIGFRVPLIVVSAYTPAGYINNYDQDFGSILRMIEGINHLYEGKLGFADKRADTDLHAFFSLTTPRTFKTIPSEKNASYFLTVKGIAVAPDDD
jgi:phospholipase C